MERHREFPDSKFRLAAEYGFTVQRAARWIGCSEWTVRQRAADLGISFVRKRAERRPKSRAGIAVPEEQHIPQTLADFAAIENAAMRARDRGQLSRLRKEGQ